MRTLDQVEPRIPIDSVPIVIDQPGSYYLTGNLDAGANTAITITAPDVSLDLMGFTLSGIGLDGVFVDGPTGGTLPGAVIRNGKIDGFAYGVRLRHSSGSLIEDLRITGASDSGINLLSSQAGSQTKGNVIRNCVLAKNRYGVFFNVGSNAENSGNRIIDTVITDNEASGIEWLATTGGRIWNNIVEGCTVTANGHVQSSNSYGIHLRPSGGEIVGNRFENCTIVFNRGRGVQIDPRNGGVFKDQVFRGNTIHNHDNAGMIIAVSLSNGSIDGLQVSDNVVSWNRFNGGIRSFDPAGISMEQLHVQNNVMADNGVGTANANLRIISNRGTVTGNHVSGATTHGLNIDGASRMVVAKNSVFGEPFSITGDSTYGPIIESMPLPNNPWANFRLE